MEIKKRLYLFFFAAALFFSLRVFSEDEAEHKRPPLRDKILADDFKITQPIKRILYSMGLSCDGDLKNVVKLTQQKWLKKNDRDTLEEVDKKRESYIYQLKEAGCIDRILPFKKNYDYCLVLGGQYQTFISRLQYLIDNWEKGVRFRSLVFLGEKRAVDFEKEKKLLLKNSNNQIRTKVSKKMPQIEIDMMKFIYENTEVPKEMRALKTVFIDGAMDISNREIVLPNIFNAILTWFNEAKPAAGSCLVVSSQPYVGYQESIVRAALNRNFEIEAIGDAALPETKVSIYLETLARWLYQEAYVNNIIVIPSADSSVKVR